MAKTQQKDILTRFQDLTAEALHRLQDVPGGAKLVDAANETKARLDEMQKKLRGLDELEKRVAKLEKQLAETKKPTQARKSSTAKKTTAGGPRRTTAPKPPA
jgi:predicted phage gp36 major capsid-like protein